MDIKTIVCSNCGAKIKDGDICEFCGLPIEHKPTTKALYKNASKQQATTSHFDGDGLRKVVNRFEELVKEHPYANISLSIPELYLTFEYKGNHWYYNKIVNKKDFSYVKVEKHLLYVKFDRSCMNRSHGYTRRDNDVIEKAILSSAYVDVLDENSTMSVDFVKVHDLIYFLLETIYGIRNELFALYYKIYVDDFNTCTHHGLQYLTYEYNEHGDYFRMKPEEITKNSEVLLIFNEKIKKDAVCKKKELEMLEARDVAFKAECAAARESRERKRAFGRLTPLWFIIDIVITLCALITIINFEANAGNVLILIIGIFVIPPFLFIFWLQSH